MDEQKNIRRCLKLSVVILLLGCVHVATPKSRLGPLTNAERQLFLMAHNAYRHDASKNYYGVQQPTAAYMKRLYWSSALEAEALAWTSRQVRKNRLDYGGTGVRSLMEFWAMLNITKEPGLGQSVAHGVGDPFAVVHMWHQETTLYTHDTNSCTKDEACFNYTQVMWANSTFVGCAIVQNQGRAPFATCDYFPPGYLGASPYIAGPLCSLCNTLTADGFTQCDDGLCEPKDKCSPVKECKVVDTENCLCSEAEYNDIVTRLVTANGLRLAPSSLLLLLSVVVLLLLISPLDIA